MNWTESPALDCACEIAVTVTTAGSVLLAVAMVGTVFGATYVLLAEIVPQAVTVVAVAVQLRLQVTA